MPAVITIQGLAKSFGVRKILTDVSFAVDAKDRIALVGVNGSGKSTLLRLIAAAKVSQDPNDAPDAGVITKQKDLTLAYVPQEPKLDPGLSIEATLRLGLTEDPDGDAERGFEVHKLAASLGLVKLDQPVGALSLGERRRVALGRALLSRPQVLALDEPTNHLDARTVAWLETQLLQQPGALLLITHDRYFLDRVATRILEVDRGQVYAYGPGYESFLEKQADRLAASAERERVRRAFVRRELDWIRRGPQARATKQQARIDRFDAAVKAGEAKEMAPTDRALQLRLPRGPRLGKTVLEVRNISKQLGGKTLFKDLSLLVKPGDRIGIVGPNGAGKTTLIKTLLGQLPPDAGDVVIGQNTKFAFLDQGRVDLDDDRSVLEEVAGQEGDQVFLEDGPIHVRSFLRMMLFDDQFADMRVGQLSGGERNRVQLARLLREGGNVLVLDEPTNDLDLITLGVLENALVEFPGCVLVVSHDRWFLDKVATGILAFENVDGDDTQGRVQFYEGNYSSYMEKWGHRVRGAGGTRPQASADKPASERIKPAPNKPRKLSYKEQRELENMEQSILDAETRVQELEATLSSSEVYSQRAAEVPQLVAQLERARAEVERLYARWQELEAVRSGA